jgi:uncharacterized membrane protein YhaH (DUF805 family)
MTSPVFISYRRSDTQHATGRLFEHLTPKYMAAADIFMDIEAIAAGANFVETLHRQLDGCQLCLVMIGPKWLEADAQGRRRIDDPNDFVRLEVAEVLARNITVIPVLVDNARMPTAAELPEPLKPLASRNAFGLLHERFSRDADALGEKMLRALGRSPDAELDLIRLLFSFKGTIGRKPFWLGLIAITAVMLAVMTGILVASGVPVSKGFLDPYSLDKKVKVLMQVGTVWIWWPALALAWKRIKDLGHGWGLFAPILGASLAEIGLDLSGFVNEAGTMSIICLVMLIVLGVLKGTRFIAHDV